VRSLPRLRAYLALALLFAILAVPAGYAASRAFQAEPILQPTTTGGPSPTPRPSPPASAAVAQSRRVAVIIGGFGDLPGYPVTAAQAVDTFDGDGGNRASVRSFFEAASRGRVTTTATVFGPWPLGIEQCQAIPSNFSGLMAAATDAAAAHGVDLAPFDHVVVWTGVPCGLTPDGLNSGGRYVHLRLDWADWPAGWNADKPAISALMAAHELVHNLGLKHADGLDCRDGSGKQLPFGGTCSAASRADPYTTMGAVGAPYHSLLDADRLRALGWLGADEWRTVHSAGTYHLVPVYSAAAGIRLLRIPRPQPVVPLGRSGAWTLEIRSTLSGTPWDQFDATADLPNLPSVTRGVTIRYSEDASGPSGDLGESYLVDTTADAAAGEPADFWDAPLQAGQTFTDSAAGLTITVDSVSAAGATVTIGGRLAP
jgi:hypothetical protein